jgi:LacI family transcriptional regulator
MREVATRAGVSAKTVSRVINNETNVNEATRARVRAAVTDLGYVLDAAAANLARVRRTSRSIALLISSVDNPFSAQLFRGVETVATHRGVMVFAASTEEDPAIEDRLISAFASRFVDGFIITPTAQDHRHIASLIGARVPVVYVDRTPAGIGADVVTSNNRESARTATAHLIRHGHTRIGLMTDHTSLETAEERRQGYVDALAANGLVQDPALMELGVATRTDAEAAATRLLDLPAPPTAIFAARNIASIGLVQVLRARGLSQTMAVVGLDDVGLSDLLDPPLTVMAQDAVAIGTLAAERLFARLDGDDTPPDRYVVPASLIERGSGELPVPR